jgi:hypothetical protein
MPKLPLETAVPLMERAKGHKECRSWDWKDWEML